MSTRICGVCKKDKPFSNFYVDKRNKEGRATTCKDCAKERSKRFYKESPDYKQSIRDSGLKIRFGISRNDYLDMLESQNGRCDICKLKFNNHLHVDHCHTSNEIRGLLCKNCNHGLGNFKDNQEFLRNAIDYLDRNSTSK